MNRLIAAIVIVLAWASVAWAEAPAPLITMHAVRALTNAEASKKQPVAFEATVTYYFGGGNDLNVQDGDDAIFVRTTKDAKLVPGDRVLVRGTTRESFNPIVLATSVTVLGHGALPEPLPATFDDLVHTKINCKLVRIRGVIRTADLQPDPINPNGRLQMLMDGGYVELTLLTQDLNALKTLLDAEVEVTGDAGRIFDAKMQQTAAKIKVSTLDDIKVLKRASANPWILPVTPMNEIITGTHVRDLTQRLRVHGVITYYQPGVAAVLQNGAESLWISTQTSEPLQIGDEADATGFPDTRDRRLTLAHAEIQDNHTQASIPPVPATWHQLAQWARNTPTGHQYDLVSIEGRVVTEVREATQDEYVLVDSEGKQFTALYRHPHPPNPLPSMLQVPLGSKIRVTGICLITDTDPYNGEAPFDVLLRSFDDIAIVAQPSLLNIRNLLLALGALLIVVFIVIARGWALERRVSRQTAVMSARTEVEADLERQRSRILEDINESRPLAEILVQIAAMVSSTLGNAPCWCEVADGERLGDCPEERNNLRIVRASIDARIGPALGVLFAGLNPDTPPIDRETVALRNGARLATLAIETRRLYSDLRRRSEYDLLTDIPNRFAIEKFIELQLEEARQSGRILGLIFIDLDEFKLVNDTYGHHVGDLYLQEVALRMSRQLLGRDMLARLGGDEFAAMVSLHNGLADLDRIVARLEHCFDRPFAIGGYLLEGGASIGIALYPKDGATKDGLLSAADTAMYTVKNNKRQAEKNPPQKPNPELSREDCG